MKKTQRNLSRVLALCLTLLMTLGLFGTSAFAAEPITSNSTGTITVRDLEDEVTVSAYQLMDVKVNENGQPQEPVYTWVNEVASWVRANYSSYIGDGTDNSVQAAFNAAVGTSDIAIFYDKLAAAIKGGAISDFTATETQNASSGTATFSHMSMGNYLILIEGGMKVYSPSAVNLVPEWKDNQWQMSDAKVEVKSSEPTINKTIKAPGTKNGLKADNANIGDTVTFDIVADVPKFPANAISKNYAISDTLPEGLTITEGSIHVYGVSGTQETELVNNETTYYNQSNKRPASEGNTTFTLTFAYDNVSSYDQIHVTYTATLNGNATLGEDGNPNHAYLDYTNNPYADSNWGGNDDDIATVYTYGLGITKVDKDNHETTLSGAEFELYGSADDATNGRNKISFVSVSESDGIYRKSTASDSTKTTTLAVNSNGKLILKGLDEGTWYLKETKAPGGYNLLASPVEVTITDTDNGTLDGKVSGAAANATGEAVALVPLTVENDDGFQLPVTGGMGIFLFTMVGVVLMGAAVLLLMVALKKRKAGN